MRISSLAANFCVVMLALAAFQSEAQAAEQLECIQGTATPEAVEAWRLKAALALENNTLSDGKVAQRVKACFPTEVPACLKRVDEYSKRSDTASSSQDVTPATSAQKRPPDELLAPGTNGLEYVIPADIEAIATAKGWPFVRYKSRHSGGFDAETPSLLMVLVPGDKVDPPVNFDRWLNFAIPADDDENALTPKPSAPVPDAAAYAAEANGGLGLPRTFTMVTLDKKVNSKPSAVYFQKFFRSGSGSPIFTPESNSSVSSCVSCHPNGLRAISPLGYHVRAGEAQLPEDDWKSAELINKLMETDAGTKSVTWREVAGKSLLTPRAFGPIVGPLKPLAGADNRTEAFIKSCFDKRKEISVTDIFGRAPGANNHYKLSATPQVNWEKVAGAMKCQTCHNDVQRGAMNDLTSWAQIDFKILVDQSMPLGMHHNPVEQGSPSEAVVDELNGDERIALTNCLKVEFDNEQTQLLKWLTAASCQQ